MSEYEPGTVAVATVRGRENVRVFCDDWDSWRHADIIGFRHTRSAFVTDIRPLVVLDLANNAHAAAALRDTLPAADSDRDAQDWLVAQIADAIEAQTGAPRIPEPGQYGVVKARWDNTIHGERHTSIDGEFIHIGPSWRSVRDGYAVGWYELIDPTLIREGLS
jgi:hypothetical protein